MPTYKLLLLAGDGIGPEVMAEVKKLIAWMNANGLGQFETAEALVGGACYDAHKVAIQDATMAAAQAADADVARSVASDRKISGDIRLSLGMDLKRVVPLGKVGWQLRSDLLGRYRDER